MQNMETTMLSLATLPRAPPAALYNPLDHGRSLAQSDNQVLTKFHLIHIFYGKYFKGMENYQGFFLHFLINRVFGFNVLIIMRVEN